MIEFLVVIAGFVLFFAVMFTLLLAPAMIAARFEKRMVWPYGPVEPKPPTGDPTGHGSLAVDEALGAGYTMIGWVRDVKGSMYTISYAMLVSEDRSALAIISVGKVIGMTVRSAWIYTMCLEGIAIDTNNDLGSCAEFDLTRRSLDQYSPTTSFRELNLRHVDLLRDRAFTPVPFMPGAELEQFKKYRIEKYDRLEQKGVIFFTTPERTHWHYTTLGGIATVLIGGVLSVARSVTGGRFPRLV